MQRNIDTIRDEQNISTINRKFYDVLWSNSRLIRPDRFNTWPFISDLLPQAMTRLELGPGLRPRLPIPGTGFIDSSPSVIDQLTKCGGIAVAGEICNLPVGDGKYELVSAFDVVEHIEDDRRVFSEVSRVLKEGGAFIFSVPIHTELWTEFDEFVGHVRRYDFSDLQKQLMEYDLVITKSAAFGMQPSAPWILNLGLWVLKHRRQKAMWWYNNFLMPLGMLFQKRLKFVDGPIDTFGIDEVVLFCQKQTRTGSDVYSAVNSG